MTNDGIVVLGEGKAQCGGTNLDTAIGQAVTYQRFSHYSYVFFPDEELSKNDLLEYVKDTLKRHGLGLLTVSLDGSVNDLLEPNLSPFLRTTNTSLFLRTFNQVVYTKELLSELDPYEDVKDKELERGLRAYLIRDFCVFFNENENFLRKKGMEELAEKYEKWVKANYDYDKQNDANYWTAQYAGAKTGLEKSRSLAAIYGAIYFEMFESKSNNNFLTGLGQSLVAISGSSTTLTSKLSKEERAFFFAIGWKSPQVRRLINGLYKNKEKKVDRSKIFENDPDISYYKKTFWLRSEIFTISKQSSYEYDPIK